MGKDSRENEEHWCLCRAVQENHRGVGKRSWSTKKHRLNERVCWSNVDNVIADQNFTTISFRRINNPSFAYLLARAFVFSKIKANLGLDQCKSFWTGAAPLSSDIKLYFASLDLLILDVSAENFTISENDENVNFVTYLGVWNVRDERCTHN